MLLICRTENSCATDDTSTTNIIPPSIPIGKDMKKKLSTDGKSAFEPVLKVQKKDSDLLMPPPSVVPPVKNSTRLCEAMCETTNTNTKNELANDDIFNDIARGGQNVSKVKRVHCSVAANPVNCSVANKPIANPNIQRALKAQLHTKIFTRPDLRFTPITKLGIEDEKNRYGRIDVEHFQKKNLNIDNVDLSFLDGPLKCSTPFPTSENEKIFDTSVIMAGSLEGKEDVCEQATVPERSPNKEVQRTEISIRGQVKNEGEPEIHSEVKNSVSDERRGLSVPKTLGITSDVAPGKKKENAVANTTKVIAEEGRENPVPVVNFINPRHPPSSNTSFCNQWMNSNNGISQRNDDRPPSIYAETAGDGNSSFNLTSVSRMAPNPNSNCMRNSTQTGRGIRLSSNLPVNTVFM